MNLILNLFICWHIIELITIHIKGVDSLAKVLVADDDLGLQKALELFLTDIGHEVFKASDGLQAIELTKAINPKIIILDVMMPKMNGLEVCKVVKSDSSIPVIILSAKDNEEDRIAGLEMGADDYLTKPFNLKELALRIDACLRYKNNNSDRKRLVYNDLIIDYNQKQILLNNRFVDLTPIEFELLWVLASNPNRIFSHQELVEKIWASPIDIHSNILQVYIRKIRNKIELDPKKPMYLHNVWGQGYSFRYIFEEV